MRTLYTGNVIESPSGGKWIVTDVNDACCEHGEAEHETLSYRGEKDRACLHNGCRCQKFRHGVVAAISFDSENCSAVQRLEDSERTQSCHCGYEDEDEHWTHDDDCEHCHGTGEYVVKTKGWKHSKVLASNVQDFILKGIKKAWNL